ncbi:MAG TPA: rRNA maturation RNase YbeY [Marinagarivorans sp.]
MTTEPNGPYIDVQVVCSARDIPTQGQLANWVAAALPADQRHSELTVRIVEPSESQQLNADYRGKDRATNVLSFPSDLPDYIDEPLLGDLVICASVVQHEATEQQKPLEAHWAHMVVHGTLHLLGYDHINDDDAHEMESLEAHILNGLGYPNPYDDPEG